MTHLTDLQIRAAKPAPKPYTIADGNGLHLYVEITGQKYWHYRYRFAGKQKRISLGIYPKVSGQKARVEAAKATALVESGVDPKAKRREDKFEAATDQALTFKKVAEAWYAAKAKTGLSKSSLEKMRTYLDKDMLPELGALPIKSVTRAHCARLQERIEKRKAHNVAKKVRGWLNNIFSGAMARSQCDMNPASELTTIAIPAPRSRPYPHLLEPELPEFLTALDKSPSRFIAQTAALMTVLTASRPGIVRFAEWEEIHLDAGYWQVPPDKMKMRCPHITPLPTQLISRLRLLHKLTGNQRWLFPGIGTVNDVISENTICLVFAKVGFKGRMVGHGSRHTASTLLRDHQWFKDVVETQLAHKEPGVAGEYNFAKYFPERMAMIQWYADYLDALKTGLTDEMYDQFVERVNVPAPIRRDQIPYWSGSKNVSRTFMVAKGDQHIA